MDHARRVFFRDGDGCATKCEARVPIFVGGGLVGERPCRLCSLIVAVVPALFSTSCVALPYFVVSDVALRCVDTGFFGERLLVVSIQRRQCGTCRTVNRETESDGDDTSTE